MGKNTDTGLLAGCRRADEGEWDGVGTHIPESWKGKWTVVAPDVFWSSHFKPRVIRTRSMVCLSGRIGFSCVSQPKACRRPMVCDSKRQAMQIARKAALSMRHYCGVKIDEKDPFRSTRTENRHWYGGEERPIKHRLVDVVELGTFDVFDDVKEREAEKARWIASPEYLKAEAEKFRKRMKRQEEAEARRLAREKAKEEKYLKRYGFKPSENGVTVANAIRQKPAEKVWYALEDQRTGKFVRVTEGEWPLVEKDRCTAFTCREQAAVAMGRVEQQGWRASYAAMRLRPVPLDREWVDAKIAALKKAEREARDKAEAERRRAEEAERARRRREWEKETREFRRRSRAAKKAAKTRRANAAARKAAAAK